MSLTAGEIDRILKTEADHECPGIEQQKICVKIVAIAELPSRFGRFQVAAFWNNRDGKEHIPRGSADDRSGTTYVRPIQERRRT